MRRCRRPVGCGWPGVSCRRAGPTGGRRSGSRSARPRRAGGLAGIGRSVGRGWSIGPAGPAVVRRVLTDNGSCYKSRLWRDTLQAKGIRHKRTRPYRPQTNGKVERYHRTLADEWAYTRPYPSDSARADAVPTWLHSYNHHRHHTAIGGPPATRVPNLYGQNN